MDIYMYILLDDRMPCFLPNYSQSITEYIRKKSPHLIFYLFIYLDGQRKDHRQNKKKEWEIVSSEIT